MTLAWNLWKEDPARAWVVYRASRSGSRRLHGRLSGLAFETYKRPDVRTGVTHQLVYGVNAVRSYSSSAADWYKSNAIFWICWSIRSNWTISSGREGIFPWTLSEAKFFFFFFFLTQIFTHQHTPTRRYLDLSTPESKRGKQNKTKNASAVSQIIAFFDCFARLVRFVDYGRRIGSRCNFFH